MRRVAHVSDLHFGREDPAVVAGLAKDLALERADLVVVSGDLTQRARSAEFEAALRFLRSLPAPFVAVPGNHDIPLYNILARATSPHSRYARYLGAERNPTWSDEELAVLGLDTSLRWVWKGGLVRSRQLAALRGWASVAGERFRIVFAHHPFTRPDTGGHSLVRGSSDAVVAMEESKVDLVLTGHHHMGGHSESRAFVVGGPHRLVIARAGTATSIRRRGEPNTYNLVHVDSDRVAIEERAWDGKAFASRHTQSYPRHGR